MKTIHPDLAQVLDQENIAENAVGNRYSDAYIDCQTYEQAQRIAQAGPWRSMAKVFRNRVTGVPCVEVPFAFLAREIDNHSKS